ncbi:MAG: DUF4385 domain-containing protein [Gemmataceae bacterium]|nr:DUF4385 domain-containing protein [Gemmataceae bacterium]
MSRRAGDSAVFDYTLDFKTTDFRQRPDLYRIGKGEQGVLLVEPYKGEILPHWRFKTVAEAKKSSATIYRMFLAYLKAETSPERTWPASSFRWAGPGRGGTPTTRAGGSTSRRPARSCPGRRTPRRRRRLRCSTNATSPPASTRSTSARRSCTRRSTRRPADAVQRSLLRISSASRRTSARISSAGRCTRWPWPGSTHSKR